MVRNRVIQFCLWIYRIFRSIGILDVPLVHALYLRVYFAYKKQFEDSLVSLLKMNPHLLQDGDVLDVGANVGYTATVLCSFLKKGQKVHAFEPDRKNYRDLIQTIDRFQMSSRIEAIPAAVGSTEGEILLWLNRDHPADHRVLNESLKASLAEKGLNPDFEKVPMITIDQYCKSKGIDRVSFLKVDVQGFELEVLKGALETIDQNPRISIYFEYCAEHLKALGAKPEALLEFFRGKGFQILEFNPKKGLVPFRRLIREGDYTDLLAVRGSQF